MDWVNTTVPFKNIKNNNKMQTEQHFGNMFQTEHFKSNQNSHLFYTKD